MKEEKFLQNFYTENFNKIHRFISSRVAPREEATDITSDVFYKFALAIKEKREIKNPLSFLFRIARNKTIDWYRKTKPESLDKKIDDSEKNSFQLKDPLSGAQIISMSETQIVLRSIKKIDRKYSEIITLRFLREMSLFDISKRLKMSQSNVSIRTKRAIKELRKVLGIQEP